jgi:hypothetical protein
VRMQPGITRQHFGLCQMAPAGGKTPAQVSPNQMIDQTVYKRRHVNVEMKNNLCRSFSCGSIDFFKINRDEISLIK